jgi:hypothetical protein
MVLLTIGPTLYIHNGDEIGMANIRFTDIGEYRGLMAINYYSRLKKEGGDVGGISAGVGGGEPRQSSHADAVLRAGHRLGAARSRDAGSRYVAPSPCFSGIRRWCWS